MFTRTHPWQQSLFKYFMAKRQKQDQEGKTLHCLINRFGHSLIEVGPRSCMASQYSLTSAMSLSFGIVIQSIVGFFWEPFYRWHHSPVNLVLATCWSQCTSHKSLLRLNEDFPEQGSDPREHIGEWPIMQYIENLTSGKSDIVQ